MPARKVMQVPERSFQLSLHVRHPSLDPREISRELQWDAEESFAAGQPRVSRSGVAVTAAHGESYWAATLDMAFWDLRRIGDLPARAAHLGPGEALGLLLMRLTRRHAAFLRRIRAEGGTLTLIMTIFDLAQQALRLPPELCARLAELGVTLELEQG